MVIGNLKAIAEAGGQGETIMTVGCLVNAGSRLVVGTVIDRLPCKTHAVWAGLFGMLAGFVSLLFGNVVCGILFVFWGSRAGVR